MVNEIDSKDNPEIDGYESSGGWWCERLQCKLCKLIAVWSRQSALWAGVLQRCAVQRSTQEGRHKRVQAGVRIVYAALDYMNYRIISIVLDIKLQSCLAVPPLTFSRDCRLQKPVLQ